MGLIQRFILAIMPKGLAGEIWAASESWKIRCLTCGASRSVWEVGGVRWKAASIGKRTLIRCSQCDRLRWAAVEKGAP